MFNKIKNLKKDELLKGSFLLIFSIFIFNLFNYFFHMLSARMLDAADYGILASLMALIYIFSIPSESIQTIITKNVSFFNKKNDGKIKNLLKKILKKCLFFAFVFFICFLFISLFLSYNLKINFLLLFLTGIFIFISFITPVIRGILQGKKKFDLLGFNIISEGLIKIILTSIFLYFGLKVYGAITAVILSSFLSFLLGFLFIKDILLKKEDKAEIRNNNFDNCIILLITMIITIFYSLDVLFARKFFDPTLSGQYSFVSLVGKINLFIGFSIGKVMFPLSLEKFNGKKQTKNLFKKAILLNLLISFVILSLYFFVPKQIIKILSLGSNKYLEASNILFILGISFVFLSFSYIIFLYLFSINKIKRFPFFTIFILFLFILLLNLFHYNIFQFSLIILFCCFLIFVYSLIYLIRK
ncbi:MAG: oligosaccharide flippase family protein [Candidatus Pacearchaeota archaeon]